MEAEQSLNIAIIGGGFCGMMTAVNLIKKANKSITIHLVEKTDYIARGVAYSTPESFHLLNVPGAQMGAFKGEAGHFFSWLEANQSYWRNVDPAFADLPLEPARFYPRRLYGFYLEQLLAEAKQEAEAKKINFIIHQAEVSEVELCETREAILRLKGGKTIRADQVVLAVGSAPTKSFGFERGMFLCDGHYTSNMWSKDQQCWLNQKSFAHLPETTDVVIIGSGLTMIDAYLTLKNKGYKGKITAISRNGKLPLPHRAVEPYPAFLQDDNFPESALSLLQRLRKEIAHAAEHHHDWRGVIQSMRPITNALWASFSVRERRRIAQKLMSFWNIHRHRVPAHIRELLDNSINEGKLSLVAGNVFYIGGKRDSRLSVSYRAKGDDRISVAEADYVVNCSGPESDLGRSQDRLISNLRDKGLITVGTLRMGVELTPSARVRGKAPDVLHAIGSLLVGEKLESTAVPDLRDQAADVADRVLAFKRESAPVYQYAI